MKIELQKPYSNDWDNGYVIVNHENRRMVCLWKKGDPDKRSTISYARYLMSVKLNRYLTPDEQVDHIDADKTNDEYSNLQVLTVQQHRAKTSDEMTQTKHGTSAMCRRRCKCDLCRAYRRAAGQRYRQKLRMINNTNQ